MLMMAVALLGSAATADAAKVSERAKQKKLAEIQRADLQEKLAQLKHEIDNTEAAKSHASDALAESEAAISDADRALHDLAQEQQAEEAKLAKIVKQQEDLKKAIALQQQKLSTSCASNIWPATKTGSNCCCPAITRIASTANCNTWVMCRIASQADRRAAEKSAGAGGQQGGNPGCQG